MLDSASFDTGSFSALSFLFNGQLPVVSVQFSLTHSDAVMTLSQSTAVAI